MAWPGPVVLVASEITDAKRRSGHQPQVGVNLVGRHIVLFPRPHTAEDALKSCGLAVALLQQRADLSASERFVRRSQFLCESLDLLCDIEDPFEEEDFLALDRNLLVIGHRPESVFQIVVLGRAELCDV